MNYDDNEQGYKYSRLWLNKYLSELNNWNIAELNKRFNLISKRFMKIWKFPDIVIEDDELNQEINIFDADDPSHKKLEYVIFFDQKFEFHTITQLYNHVMKILFDLTPTIFFSQNLEDKLGLTKIPTHCTNPISLNETYFIEGSLSSKNKFERIKSVLTLMDVTDELFVKFSEMT